ncbi:hypothetical protein [Sutterella sp.]|uniref:beta strand repeat-containing protein n=1 Tax=Sutterella sp. TaxID=1981025 RepID=UPI0026DFA540|nr:hypothetical protein [Sutterella sp.]MDO5532881.1 hypothetical protein [Sutterella sp.]
MTGMTNVSGESSSIVAASLSTTNIEITDYGSLGYIDGVVTNAKAGSLTTRTGGATITTGGKAIVTTANVTENLLMQSGSSLTVLGNGSTATAPDVGGNITVSVSTVDTVSAYTDGNLTVETGSKWTGDGTVNVMGDATIRGSGTTFYAAKLWADYISVEGGAQVGSVGNEVAIYTFNRSEKTTTGSVSVKGDDGNGSDSKLYASTANINGTLSVTGGGDFSSTGNTWVTGSTLISGEDSSVVSTALSTTTIVIEAGASLGYVNGDTDQISAGTLTTGSGGAIVKGSSVAVTITNIATELAVTEGSSFTALGNAAGTDAVTTGTNLRVDDSSMNVASAKVNGTLTVENDANYASTGTTNVMGTAHIRGSGTTFTGEALWADYVDVYGGAQVGSEDDGVEIVTYLRSDDANSGNLRVYSGDGETDSKVYATSATIAGDLTVTAGADFASSGETKVTGRTDIDGSTSSVVAEGGVTTGDLQITNGASLGLADGETSKAGALTATGSVAVSSDATAVVTTADIETKLSVSAGGSFTSTRLEAESIAVTGAGSSVLATAGATTGSISVTGTGTAAFSSLALTDGDASVISSGLVYVGDTTSTTLAEVQESLGSSVAAVLYIDDVAEDSTFSAGDGITVGAAGTAAAAGQITVGSGGTVVVGDGALSESDNTYTIRVTGDIVAESGGLIDLTSVGKIDTATVIEVAEGSLSAADPASILTGSTLYAASVAEDGTITFGLSSSGTSSLTEYLSDSLASAISAQLNGGGASASDATGAGCIVGMLESGSSSEDMGRAIESVARIGAQSGVFQSSVATVGIITGMTESRLGFNTAAASPAVVRLNGSSQAFSLAGAFADASITMTDTQAPAPAAGAFADDSTVAWVSHVYSKTKSDGFGAGHFSTGVDAQFYGVALGVD